MLVDSSALPEQVVTDVIASAFNSSGRLLGARAVPAEGTPRVPQLLEGATRCCASATRRGS
jgi:delta 1-pyrroline-5-carboxylate dehydrogenase